MFCSSCGNTIPDGSHFCNSCGAATVVTDPTKPVEPSQPIEFMQPSSTQESVRSQADLKMDYPSPEHPKYPHPYQQFGGWLGFIAWAEIIGSVLLALYCLPCIPSIFLIVQSRGVWNGFIYFAHLAGFGLAAFFGILVFTSIMKKSSRFLRLFEIQSILYIAGNMIFLFPNNRIISIVQQRQTFGIIIILVIAFFILTAYFRKSVRVRTYTGSDQYLKQSLFFRRCTAPASADTQPYVPRSAEIPLPRENRCPACNSVNAPATSFCGSCGAKMPVSESYRNNIAQKPGKANLLFLVPGIAGIVGVVAGFVMMLCGSSMNENVDMNDVMNEAFSSGRVNAAPGNGLVELGQVVIILGALLLICAVIVYFYKKSSGKNR